MSALQGLRIETSTPFILLQDGGRFGCRHLGVTQGGAMDWVSMSWANWLLGNPLDAAVVEIGLGGFSLTCQQDGCLALAGADLGATLDGQPLPLWSHFKVSPGQRLAFAHPRRGARAYLAAPGGFLGKLQLGSLACVGREALGGLHADGKALAAGDQLTWHGEAAKPRVMPRAGIPDLAGEVQLEVILGAQIGDFSGQSLFDAFNSDWTVDTRSDRMGVRLLGPVLECKRQSMVSEGIGLGALQVPPDGQPIALLNDRQTIGGYPRLGALTPLAVARLAQCLPGTSLRFAPTVQEAAHRAHQQRLATWWAD
ncbi:5-oxoprolinase subunit C family protein [Metapseudomonas boanensis]|uniref:Biotin-dependent carboxyltransferase n=1 Tax=Metapseudomonas boanensis TaxID=2822138 RepID=A0ABS5XME6_9GAMM|nr:biotin-dependent carboxyltransferase family protein [Pseudomonas boanensis]MBT8768881.1 biotin-dependent carboxyltransferase [Pseudomonas boanensis]